MLIFWKLVLPEDAPLFSKNIDESDHDAMKPYTPTSLDRTLNQAMGIFMILTFLISTSLNILVYQFNKLKRNNITNFLFRSLAAVDFLTTLFAPLTYAALMFSATLYPCSNKVLTFARSLACALGCISQVITWLLAVTRCIRVIFPFAIMKKRVVFGYLAVYALAMLLNSCGSAVVQLLGAYLANLFVVLVHYCFVINFGHCLTGIIVSVATFAYLLRCTRLASTILTRTRTYPLHEDYRAKATLIRGRFKGCVTILLMNIPYVINIGFIAYVNIKPGTVSFHDVLFGMVPILTSTINPIIITARNHFQMRLLLLNKKRPAVVSRIASMIESPRPKRRATDIDIPCHITLYRVCRDRVLCRDTIELEDVTVTANPVVVPIEETEYKVKT